MQIISLMQKTVVVDKWCDKWNLCENTSNTFWTACYTITTLSFNSPTFYWTLCRLLLCELCYCCCKAKRSIEHISTSFIQSIILTLNKILWNGSSMMVLSHVGWDSNREDNNNSIKRDILRTPSHGHGHSRCMLLIIIFNLVVYNFSSIKFSHWN